MVVAGEGCYRSVGGHLNEVGGGTCHSEAGDDAAGRNLGPGLALGMASCHQSRAIVNDIKSQAVNLLTGAPATSAAEVTARRAVKRILTWSLGR